MIKVKFKSDLCEEGGANADFMRDKLQCRWIIITGGENPWLTAVGNVVKDSNSERHRILDEVLAVVPRKSLFTL